MEWGINIGSIGMSEGKVGILINLPTRGTKQREGRCRGMWN